MRLIKKISVLLALCLVLIGATTLETTSAQNYCSGGASSGYSQKDGVRVEKGHSTAGACHIQRLHMASPGGGSYVVDGELKSQFNFAFDRDAMANIAAIVIKNSTTYDSKGNNVNEAYVVSLNQDVRVVWYHKTLDNVKVVITMYPIKSYGPDGPIVLPHKLDPINELESVNESYTNNELESVNKLEEYSPFNLGL